MLSSSLDPFLLPLSYIERVGLLLDVKPLHPFFYRSFLLPTPPSPFLLAAFFLLLRSRPSPPSFRFFLLPPFLPRFSLFPRERGSDWTRSRGFRFLWGLATISPFFAIPLFCLGSWTLPFSIAQAAASFLALNLLPRTSASARLGNGLRFCLCLRIHS